MFQKVHADPYFELELPRYEGSINPELDPMEFGLNPFYAGRPLEMSYLDSGFWRRWLYRMIPVVGLVLLIKDVIFLVIWLGRQMGRGAVGIMRSEERQQAEEFIEQYGQDIGKQNCGKYEGQGTRYIKCRAEEVELFLEEFIMHARECTTGSHPGRQKIKGKRRYSFNLDKERIIFRCVQMTEWQKGHFKQHWLKPEWDPKPWLR